MSEDLRVPGRFFSRDALEWDAPSWGRMAWISTPRSTGAKHLVAGEVEFAPGGYHHFHYHPGQEELLYVLEGRIEQWLDREQRELGPGESLFIGPDVVHASFNVHEGPSRIFVALGPCAGDEGYGAVEVAAQEPWNSLRPV